MASILVGCDPELMIQNKKSGELVSAIGLVPGEKHEPHKLNNGACLADNVNLEFNTSPAKSAEDFCSIIKEVLKQSVVLVGEDNQLIVKASANFPASALMDPLASVFGCDPDFDAWSVAVNIVPEGAAESSFRSAGGHIHIGYTEKTKELLESFEGKLRVIKAMDAIVGIWSVVLDKDKTSPARRSLYGKAGCHRPKDYGVEYRSIGNFWVNSPELATLMFEMTNFVVEFVAENKDAALIEAIGKDNIVNTINSSDVDSAKAIIQKYLNKIMPENISALLDKVSAKEYSFYQEWSLV